MSYPGKVRLGNEAKVYDAAMTFEEIAQKMGITKQLVWFYYSSAIRKLRRNGNVHRLREIARSRESQP